MALGDGIRRNIASVDPTERALLRDALIALNQRLFPGSRTDTPIPGGVSWWFKQDEIHQATHVHGGPEFLPWHREITNRLEEMLRQINPQLSLHYWDWTQNPTNIPNANLGGGTTGTFDLFTANFMGEKNGLIGEPWLSAGYYVPGAPNFRSTNPFDPVNKNPADPPREVTRVVVGPGTGPESAANDNAIVGAGDYAAMASALELAHNRAHGFVNMGSQHTSFRDPFVFLLHSNVDRLFARWQTDPAHPERLDPNAVYGSETGNAGLNSNIRPWSGVPPTTRPWSPPENQQVAKNYKHPSVVAPPSYDTNPATPDSYAAIWEQRQGPSWQARHGLTSAQYQQAFNDLVSQGFRLVQVSGYGVNGEDRDAAIWEQSGGPVWQARHGLTSAQYQQAFNDLVGQGFRLVQVSGYGVGGQDFYAAIWEQRQGPPWQARHGLSSTQYQHVFNGLVGQGFRLVQVSGYSTT